MQGDREVVGWWYLQRANEEVVGCDIIKLFSKVGEIIGETVGERN